MLFQLGKFQLFLTNFMLTGSMSARLYFDAKFTCSEQMNYVKMHVKVTEFQHHLCA